MKNHFRYLCGRLVEIHSALVAANIWAEDVLQGEVGWLLVLLEEGPPGHHVDVRPVPGLAHFLVPAVVAENRRNDTFWQSDNLTMSIAFVVKEGLIKPMFFAFSALFSFVFCLCFLFMEGGGRTGRYLRHSPPWFFPDVTALVFPCFPN